MTVLIFVLMFREHFTSSGLKSSLILVSNLILISATLEVRWSKWNCPRNINIKITLTQSKSDNHFQKCRERVSSLEYLYSKNKRKSLLFAVTLLQNSNAFTWIKTYKMHISKANNRMCKIVNYLLLYKKICVVPLRNIY